MNTKKLKKNAQKFMLQNRKSIAKVMHYIPAPPFIYFIFDVSLPKMLRKKFLKKFKNDKTNFQFVISDMPGVKSWVVEIDHGKARVFRGELDFPETILNTSARDFLDITTGYLKAPKALIAGRMTINGPVMKMKIFQSLFS
jgi:putative sterol carrier protein